MYIFLVQLNAVIFREYRLLSILDDNFVSSLFFNACLMRMLICLSEALFYGQHVLAYYQIA